MNKNKRIKKLQVNVNYWLTTAESCRAEVVRWREKKWALDIKYDQLFKDHKHLGELILSSEDRAIEAEDHIKQLKMELLSAKTAHYSAANRAFKAEEGLKVSTDKYNYLYRKFDAQALRITELEDNVEYWNQETYKEIDSRLKVQKELEETTKSGGVAFAELGHIDALLARREALDGFDTRFKKIEYAFGVASKFIDIKAELLEELNELQSLLGEANRKMWVLDRLDNKEANDYYIEEFRELLLEVEPHIKKLRKDYGNIPRPGTDLTFFHTLSYDVDIILYQKIRRLHRKIVKLTK